MSADTGQPLRRARVTVGAPELKEPRGALTDEQGRYEFTELPAGRFTVLASKGGYGNISFGQRRTFEAPRPLELADKQLLEKIDFSLPRGGVVTGRIVDEFGEPVTEAAVQVTRPRYTGGQRRLTAVGRATTNDLGEFRVYGLLPGEYYVTASISAGPAAVLNIGGGSGYVPTYYPGTPSPAEAERISVALGQETSGLVFSMAVAVEYLETGEEMNPEMLEQLRSSATRVTLKQAEMRAIDLKLSSY